MQTYVLGHNIVTVPVHVTVLFDLTVNAATSKTGLFGLLGHHNKWLYKQFSHCIMALVNALLYPETIVWNSNEIFRNDYLTEFCPSFETVF